MRLKILRQAEAIALKEQPLIPLYVYTRSQLVKPYVRGIWGNHQDRHPWKYIWIDKTVPSDHSSINRIKALNGIAAGKRSWHDQ
jgi:hypothetical protein